MKKQTLEKNKKVIQLAVACVALTFALVKLDAHLNQKSLPGYQLSGSSYNLNDLNRSIASAEPLSLDNNLDWENKLAEKLNKDNLINEKARKPASFAEKPSMIDQLKFGELEGKYRIKLTDNRINEIEYIDSVDVTDRPVFLSNAKNFLIENKKQILPDSETVKLEEKTSTKEVYKILSKKGATVGQAAFLYDEAGRFVSLKIDK